MANNSTTVVLKPTGVLVLGVMLSVGVCLTIAVPRFLAATTAPAPAEPLPADPTPAPAPESTADTVTPSAVVEGAPAGKGALLIARGQTLLDAGDPSQMTVVPGPTARVSVLQANPAEFWKAQTSLTVKEPLKLGQKLHLHLRARSESSNPVFLTLEKAGPPFSKDLAYRVQLTPDWKSYDLQFAATQNHAPGDAALRLQLGEKVGALEVTDLELKKL